MDALGLALLGIFLVSFTVSKPLSLYHQSTLSSSESSESNEPSSSEEVAVPKTTSQPVELNTMGPERVGDNLQQTNNPTTHPGIAQTPLDPSLIEQEIVEFDLNISFVPLDTAVPATGGPNAAPDVTTPEIRCYVVPLTSSEPQPARGDNI